MVSSSAGALPGSKIKTGLVSKSEFLRVSELFLNCGLNFTKKVQKKVPKKIKLVDKIPVTANLKIDKKKIRELFEKESKI